MKSHVNNDPEDFNNKANVLVKLALQDPNSIFINSNNISNITGYFQWNTSSSESIPIDGNHRKTIQDIIKNRTINQLLNLSSWSPNATL